MPKGISEKLAPRLCEYCSKEFVPSQKISIYCSRKCKTKDWFKSKPGYIKNRRAQIKKQCVDYKGGKCIFCGYCKHLGALQFHHLDPTQKDFAISMRRETIDLEVTKRELDKCILVCANCHFEIHTGDRKIL